MSRLLLLLRHAEAQVAGADLADFDRVLTERGRDQVREAARRLIGADLHPDLLLVSPAARTRETAEILQLALGSAVRMLLPAQLYLAEAPVLLSTLRGCDDGAQTVLVVGHNPGLSDLAGQLAQSAARGRGNGSLDLGLGALCRLTVQAASWRALEPAAVSAVARL